MLAQSLFVGALLNVTQSNRRRDSHQHHL